jgi:hypothetical protein
MAAMLFRPGAGTDDPGQADPMLPCRPTQGVVAALRRAGAAAVIGAGRARRAGGRNLVRGAEVMMSDTESDYLGYEAAKAQEGGVHTGRSQLSPKLLWTAAAALLLVVLGLAELAFFSAK